MNASRDRSSVRVPGQRSATIGVACGDVGTRTRELTCDGDFVTFLADDVPAWAGRHGAIRPEPARTIVAG